MNKIVVTGYSGFVGKNMVNNLSNRYETIFVSFRESNTKVILHPDVTTVIHLVGKAHDLKKISNPQEYYEVNTQFTETIFDAFLISDAKVFITLSSVKAAADNTEEILTEDFIPNPLTHYGKSKRLAEEYILANLRKDKRVYILRPCMIHGEGSKGNLTLLYNFVQNGIPYPLGAYDNKRSFLSIENLCFVVNELIEGDDIPSGIYNVADDDPVSTKDLITLFSQVTRKKIIVWKIPKFIISTIAKLGDYIPLLINTERVTKMTENYVVSNQKIKNALGKHLPISSQDGLRKTIESLKK